MKYYDDLGNDVTDQFNGLGNQLAAARDEIDELKAELKKRHTPKKRKPSE